MMSQTRHENQVVVTHMNADPVVRERVIAPHTQDVLIPAPTPSTLPEQQPHDVHKLKMHEVGQFVGGVADDFNDLLTIISGYNDLLLGMLPPNDPMTEAVTAISEAGERAAGLTRRLTSFGRQVVAEPKVLDLNDKVHEIDPVLRRMAGPGIVLTTNLDPNIRPVKVDSGQLEQVLMHLVVNARDAMHQVGKLTIETSNVERDEADAARHPDGKPGRYVRLAVSDNGCGMTPEVMSHIFEPFFTTKGPGRGAGLGLATVYGIVKQSGGVIELDTKPGCGTTFRIDFPAVDEPRDSAAQSLVTRR